MTSRTKLIVTMVFLAVLAIGVSVGDEVLTAPGAVLTDLFDKPEHSDRWLEVRGVEAVAAFAAPPEDRLTRSPWRVVVPRDAVIHRGPRGERAMVFVFEGTGDRGLAKWRYVNLGKTVDDLIEIVREGPESGTVEPGEIVLVEGHEFASHDAPVRLLN